MSIYGTWCLGFVRPLPLLLTVLVVIGLAPIPSHGLERELLERIVEAAETFITDELSAHGKDDARFSIGRIDERLNLARCASPPRAQLAPGGRLSGNTTINVRCDGPVTWSIFVPVSIQSHAKVVVTTRPLSRGHIIRASDVRMQRTVLEDLYHGYFSSVQAVEGMEVRRSLRAGQILNKALLNKATLVRRGQQVTIRVNRPGFSVKMHGIALKSAREGERIRVRNSASGRIVEGQVDASGDVQIQ